MSVRACLLLMLAMGIGQGAAAEAPLAAIALPGDRLHPESVSILPDGTAFVGSMSGGVLRVSVPTGRVEQWIAPGAFGSGALFGVFADTRNKLLWTCTNSFPGLLVKGSDEGAWLKAFSLATGAGKVSLKLPGEKPMCNDIAVGRDGSVYVTDTGNPRILRWTPKGKTLEIWAEDPIFGPAPEHGGLDGIALGGDGNVYVNNVSTGAIYRVTVDTDGKAGKIAEIHPSRPLGKPDGMRLLEGADFVVAEGDGHIARLSVKADDAVVTTIATGTTQSTGVDSYAGKAWFVQAYLGSLFQRPQAPRPELPFKLSPVPLVP
jgi:sugar lactone lactonase YvrE